MQNLSLLSSLSRYVGLKTCDAAHWNAGSVKCLDPASGLSTGWVFFDQSKRPKRITVWGAVSLGVGSIVGAGIFALMGVAAEDASSAIWLSFLVAGVIALLTGHSFAQLGIRYPSQGGAVEYLVQAYGTGWFSGACSILFYIVILLYVGLAVAVVGVVSEEQLLSSGPALIAVAARSIFGEIGFTVLLLSAVISSVTCINGGLFGITSTTFTLAEHGRLPQRFKREIGASTRGMTISATFAILLLNVFTLSTVASLGAATSLLVYSLVNFGALRLVGGEGLNRVVIFASVLACSFAVLLWVLYTLNTAPASLAVFFSFLVIAFVAENLLRRHRGRILPRQDWDAKPASRQTPR